MKVIFLDIDGVLNTSQTFIDIHNEYLKTSKKRIEIDLDRLNYLKEIVAKTGAVIVLISSWRYLGKMQNGKYIPLCEKMASLIQIFANYGLSIYDITPKDEEGKKYKEIKEWLKDKEVENFIIIDDEVLNLQEIFPKEIIKTSFKTEKEINQRRGDALGLCESHVKDAIRKLNMKN